MTNSANVIAACTSTANAGQGGTVYFSSGPTQGGLYVFNSPLHMASCPIYTKLQLATQAWLTQPWLSRAAYEIEGLAQANGGNNPSFVTDHFGQISGNAYPLLLFSPGMGIGCGSNTLTNLSVQGFRNYQDDIFS